VGKENVDILHRVENQIYANNGKEMDAVRKKWLLFWIPRVQPKWRALIRGECKGKECLPLARQSAEKETHVE